MDLYLLDCQLRAMRERVRFCAADTLSSLLPASPFECKWRSSHVRVPQIKMSKSVGSNCCIVDCACTSAKCRGLSFHCLPKAGTKTEPNAEWRARLLHAINRIDSSFNADNVKICSRHFTDDCFKYGKFLGIVIDRLITAQ